MNHLPFGWIPSNYATNEKWKAMDVPNFIEEGEEVHIVTLRSKIY